jgi:hypothetical protein
MPDPGVDATRVVREDPAPPTSAGDSPGVPSPDAAGAPNDSSPTPVAAPDARSVATNEVGSAAVNADWVQLDIGRAANRDSATQACPDPDEMVTKGTADYKDGVWTLTGSGEGFMHGWDQGNLVYMKAPVRGDFTFSAQVKELAATDGKALNGAAEAILNVRDDLLFKQPAHSIIAGRMPGHAIFMARFEWKQESAMNGVGTRRVEDKWWYWPAWPDTWPRNPSLPWIRVQRRAGAVSAFNSRDGVTWEEIKENDAIADWYPFRISRMKDAVYLGLGCSARNDRNYAPYTTIDGQRCRDPSSDVLRRSARCVFGNVTVTTP